MAGNVKPDVFFETPPGLPRGPHQLSREEVEHAQRQRLLVAFTELLADRGYAKLRIVDITRRAGVSNDSFYQLFASKEDCACAAYDQFVKVIVRLAEDAGLSQSKTWRDFIQASVEGYLGTLTADLVVARAFQLEMDMIGGKARERRKATAMWFAKARLDAQERLRETDPRLRRRPLSTHLAAVLGMRELACETLESSLEPDFGGMIEELVDWVVTAWYDEAPEVSVAATDRFSRVKPVRGGSASSAI